MNERYAGKPDKEYKFTLPKEVPNFQGVELPHAVTRNIPSGCNHDNSCIYCVQNVFGNKKNKNIENTSSSLVCSKCLQPLNINFI